MARCSLCGPLWVLNHEKHNEQCAADGERAYPGTRRDPWRWDRAVQSPPRLLSFAKGTRFESLGQRPITRRPSAS